MPRWPRCLLSRTSSSAGDLASYSDTESTSVDAFKHFVYNTGPNVILRMRTSVLCDENREILRQDERALSERPPIFRINGTTPCARGVCVLLHTQTETKNQSFGCFLDFLRSSLWHLDQAAWLQLAQSERISIQLLEKVLAAGSHRLDPHDPQSIASSALHPSTRAHSHSSASTLSDRSFHSKLQDTLAGKGRKR